jgi:hypothetical protein
MQDVNLSDDLRQLSLGQVKTLEYGRYDINRYCFWTAKLEASHPLAATTNNGVVANGKDTGGLVADYNGVLQKIIEYTFSGTKELKVVFFQCDWFDPANDTRVGDFGGGGEARIALFRHQFFVCTSSASGVLHKLSS